MKLSEAVRMGSQWADVHGPVFHGDACCAIGGVIKAIGQEFNRDVVYSSRLPGGELWSAGFNAGNLSKFFPLILAPVDLPVTCPGFCDLGSRVSMGTAIVALFEGARWSKKAIAEWVETIEKKLEAGDKGEDAKGVTNSPPPCAHEDVKDCTPAEVTASR